MIVFLNDCLFVVVVLFLFVFSFCFVCLFVGYQCQKGEFKIVENLKKVLFFR